MQIPPEMIPSEETSFVAKIVLTIFGGFITFVSGVVSATYVITVKIKGFESRLSTVEENQRKCQSGPLSKIEEKLDFIIEEGFPRVHDRIDKVLLRDGSHEYSKKN